MAKIVRLNDNSDYDVLTYSNIETIFKGTSDFQYATTQNDNGKTYAKFQYIIKTVSSSSLVNVVKNYKCPSIMLLSFGYFAYALTQKINYDYLTETIIRPNNNFFGSLCIPRNEYGSIVSEMIVYIDSDTEIRLDYYFRVDSMFSAENAKDFVTRYVNGTEEARLLKIYLINLGQKAPTI